MLDRFITHIQKHQLLEPHQTYVVAVSGGIDSIVLLDMLSRLSREWGWHLIVAHLDHAQRPDSSETAMQVGVLADQAGHRFVLHQLDKGNQLSENTMRIARYDWLKQVMADQSAAAILTAHHQDDRLETAVWHAIRGSGRHGLTSLQAAQGSIIRPLLNFRRGDIVAYAHSRKLDWHEDPSNQQPKYTRNVIRTELLHKAPLHDAHYQRNLIEWLNHLQQLNGRIDRQLEALAERVCLPLEDASGWRIKRTVYLLLEPRLKRELLLHLIRNLNFGKNVTRRNLLAAVEWIGQAPTGSFSEALPGLLLTREYDTVSLVIRSAPLSVKLASEHLPLAFSTPIRFGRWQLQLVPSLTATDDAYHLRAGTYFVRNWQAGDRVQPMGMAGTKKVQDVFVDRKIPRRDRLIWPLIVSSGNDIALIPGLIRDRRFATEPDRDGVALEIMEVAK